MNSWGGKGQEGKVWLGKWNPIPNTRLENQTRAGFSALLTTRRVFENGNLHLIFGFQRAQRTE